MRLTEQFKNRLKKLAGLKPKQPKLGPDSEPIKPYPQKMASANPCETLDLENFAISLGIQPGSSGYTAAEQFCIKCETNSWAPFPDADAKCECCDYVSDTTVGCTDTQAANYNASATEDDGSCYWDIYACSPSCEYVQIGTVGAGGTIDESLLFAQNFGNGTYWMGSTVSVITSLLDTNSLPQIQGGWTPWYNEPWGTYSYNYACTTEPGNNLLNTPNNSTIAPFYGSITSAPNVSSFSNPYCSGEPVSVDQFCDDEEWSSTDIYYQLCN